MSDTKETEELLNKIIDLTENLNRKLRINRMFGYGSAAIYDTLFPVFEKNDIIMSTAKLITNLNRLYYDYTNKMISKIWDSYKSNSNEKSSKEESTPKDDCTATVKIQLDTPNKNDRSYNLESINLSPTSVTNSYIFSVGDDDKSVFDVLENKDFIIKNVQFSGKATIVTWKSGDKTIVTMSDCEKEYDFEKAIMAAYMKKILSLYNDKSVNNITSVLEKCEGKYLAHKAEIREALNKTKERKDKKNLVNPESLNNKKKAAKNK